MCHLAHGIPRDKMPCHRGEHELGQSTPSSGVASWTLYFVSTIVLDKAKTVIGQILPKNPCVQSLTLGIYSLGNNMEKVAKMCEQGGGSW